MTKLSNNLKSSIELRKALIEDSNLDQLVTEISNLLVACFSRKGKVLFCGNGGSAADAQHLAAEFSGRYYFDRPPLYSEALHVNSSYVTAVANDYSFDEIYARMVRAMGQEGDVIIGMSTSGNSPNVVNALITAKELGMTVIGFTGNGGGKMRSVCDISIEIPSIDTPRIQECHMLIGHTICEMVEAEMFAK